MDKNQHPIIPSKLSMVVTSLLYNLSLRSKAESNSHSNKQSKVFFKPAGIQKQDGILEYIQRINGRFDIQIYRKIIGAASEFKEGDQSLGVAAENAEARLVARHFLANTKIKDLQEHPLYEDEQQKLIWANLDKAAYENIKDMTLGQLKVFLLTKAEAQTKKIMPGLNSDVIACVVKLMTNKELIKIGQTVFNSLPNSKIGSKGYMGARIQPNSPTDNTEDIVWEVFNGFSYAVGDVMLGNNPVDSTPESVARIELALKDIIQTFKLKGKLPWSVLAHIDVQNQVEKKYPGSTELFFQSIAGVDGANNIYDISVSKMMDYAGQRTGQFGLYLETGQGAEFTNGQANGFDMVVHESRKYGFARAMKLKIATVKLDGKNAYVVINDVAGFIGPEVFTSREQLVRACLEDIVMGKLHGLTIGLDICTTLHMSVSLDDLEWCQDQIMPANPAYLMALPTRNDPMLSYLTTSFQDHVRIREKFGFKVNDVIWEFYKSIQVIDSSGHPTRHFGDPIWVYYQYRILKGDRRSQSKIYAEGKSAIKKIRGRGVPITQGYGKNIWNLQPNLDKEIHDLYSDAKKSIWLELPQSFIDQIPNAAVVQTNSKDRDDYIGHPVTGESLSVPSISSLATIKEEWKNKKFNPNVQLVISDGLNVRALTDENHFQPYYDELMIQLQDKGFEVSPKNIVVKGGRVRVGYRIGELLFSEPQANEIQNTLKAVIHLIGERPGNGHQTFSAYIVSTTNKVWRQTGVVDHNIAKLVSGIADTALDPKEGARQTVQLLQEITQ